MNKPATDFAASSTRARFSTAEFLRMGESGAFDDMWVELVDGELERMPPPGNLHSARQTELLAVLLSVLRRDLIRVELGIDLGDDTAFACDAAILRQPINRPGLLRPDEINLVVEVAETTRDRDLGMKRLRYAAAGIQTYWVVDNDRSVVHVYDRPEDGDYKGVAIVKLGEPLTIPGTDTTIVLD